MRVQPSITHLECSASEFLHPRVMEQVREEILHLGGCEVMFVGQVSEDSSARFGRVIGVRPVASGVENQVPAPFEKACAGQIVLHNHPGGDLHPSEADIAIAGRAAMRGVGFAIVDNLVTRVRIVVTPFTRKELLQHEQDRLWAHCWDAMREAVGTREGTRRLIDSFDPRLAVPDMVAPGVEGCSE